MVTQNRIRTINIIGAGNVAFRLGFELKRKGYTISEVSNRTPGPGKSLARKLGARFVPAPGEMDPTVDLVIISVSDSAIAEVAGKLHVSGLVVHTSGSMEMNVLHPASSRTGVFYPVQTFRKNRRIGIKKVPFCIEAGNAADENLLLELGSALSGKVMALDSDHRRLLHLAAVFASNFTNFMYAVSEEILSSNEIPFDLLQPIIRQTAENAEWKDVFALQTGPAVRDDQEVISLQRRLLREHPEYLKIYDILTQSIMDKKQKHAKL